MGLRRAQGSTVDRDFLVGVSQIGLLQGNHGDHIGFTKSEDLPGNRSKTGKSAVRSGISPSHGANHQNVESDREPTDLGPCGETWRVFLTHIASSKTHLLLAMSLGRLGTLGRVGAVPPPAACRYVTNRVSAPIIHL